ncbi:MAG: Pr6Pr family membrane protein [Lachnospiraceae bacterium]|nr:Pr6Pr family membrane protein [Lachnospiraceae bacterium]
MNSISSTKKAISLFLKAVVIVSALSGTFISAYSGRNSFMGGSTVFMFFTIQSNIAMAIISAIGFNYLIKRKKPDVIWQIIKYVGTVSITLTGVVFCFVLAPTLGAHAWNIHNVLTHVIVPVASIVDFFVIGELINLNKKSVIFVIIPPLLYAIYAGIGYVRGWQFVEGYNYPYFFLNWGSKAGAFGFTNELPYMGTVWWILALLIFLIFVGLLYLFFNDLIKKRNK